MNKSTKK